MSETGNPLTLYQKPTFIHFCALEDGKLQGIRRMRKRVIEVNAIEEFYPASRRSQE